jgi:hypothetical protein
MMPMFDLFSARHGTTFDARKPEPSISPSAKKRKKKRPSAQRERGLLIARPSDMAVVLESEGKVRSSPPS